MPQSDRDTDRAVLRRMRWVGGAFVCLAVVVVAHGMVSRAAQNSRLHALTEAEAVPTVAIVAPTDAQDHAGLDLPGRLEAYIRAPIYARVPGYLKSWKYDIGSKVRAGDLLAEIDAPDLDALVKHGLGLRWSFMGPLETIDLNAPGGLKDYCNLYGPLYAKLQEQAVPLQWDEALVNRLHEARRDELPLNMTPVRQEWRDRRLMALLAHKAQQSDLE